MSSDLLQSNLFSPTAPTERQLREILTRKHNKRTSHLKRHATEDFSIIPLNSNNNHNHFTNKNVNRSISSIHSGCRSTNSTIVINSGSRYREKDNSLSSKITPPMLNSVLAEGLVSQRLHGDPHTPCLRNLKSEPSSSRRERLRKSFNQSIANDRILFASTREILFQDTEFQNHSHRKSKESLPLTTPEPIIDILVLENSSTDLNTSNEWNNQRRKIIENTVQNDFSGTLQLQNQNAVDEIIKCPRDKIKEVKDLDDSKIVKETTDPHQCKSVGMFKKGQFDGINENQVKEIKPMLLNNVSTQVIPSSFRETLEQMASFPAEKVDRADAEIRRQDYKEPFSKSDSLDENSDYYKKLSDRKKLLHLLHVFFRIHRKRNSQKDDKRILVEQEIEDVDDNHRKISLQNMNKKENRKHKKPLSFRLQHVLAKVLRERAKEQVEPSTIKKKRRLRKKNVSRAGRQIGHSIGYGCRYIGHGLANMTSIIPEASYAGNMNDFIGYESDYVKNDYYDPNAPSWHYEKGPYVRRPNTWSLNP